MGYDRPISWRTLFCPWSPGEGSGPCAGDDREATQSSPDKTATAPAQILGSFSPGSGSWLWAWANKSILPGMSRDALGFRDWAEANGHPALAQPKTDVDEQGASTLVALAVRGTGAEGYYKGPGGNSAVIITFGPVTLTAADGKVSTFTVNVD
ncbi:DUF6882 domain-containing protein [Streptomyces sp. NPDC001822]|uniref:DUF6882 domain-containing protein n=1 Tax=Streptomyces sp. NPDC001822 TaxID=3364614 RepID=UPI0036BD28D4